MNRIHSWFAFALGLAAPLAAQESASDRIQEPAARRMYDGAAGNVMIETPQRVGDVRIDIDGRIDEPAWEDAAQLTGFTQFEPSEGIPASQDTRVSVFVTEDAIYFAVRAFDERPEGIRASMSERDEIVRNDDYVRLVLDTFNDQRRAYAFHVNPFGVQQDGIWLEGGGGHRGFGPPIDYNPDFLWESAGKLENWGYAVEVRVPFKSLRFPQVPMQSWGIQVTRRIQRTGYQQSWAPSFAGEPNKLSEAGRLLGLADLDPGLFLQVNPVVTGRRSGALDDTDVFTHGDPEGEVGLNLTYGLTSNLTLDGTVNPDFSQVEADAGQIAVNERFALFFPEKRPFFLEGTEIFGLPQNLVFTRTIANPMTGAKVTGKVGRASIGYLGAIDEFDGEEDVFANLVRLRQDVGRANTIGAVYTDRTRSSDEFNRVAGVDGRFVLANRYTLSVQGAGSWDRDPGEHRRWGGLAYASIERAGRAFTGAASFLDVDHQFRTESGFLRRTGEVQLEVNDLRVSWYGRPGALLEQWGPGFEARGFWDHDAFWNGEGLKEAQLQLQWQMSFRGNVSVWLTGFRNEFDFGPESYEGLFVDRGAEGLAAFAPDQGRFSDLYGFRAFAWFSGLETIRGRISGEFKETPIFDVATRSPVEVANGWNGEIDVTLRPSTSLRIEAALRGQRLTRERDGSVYSTAVIPRIKAQYQFNRSFFVRGIFEYASQERGALLDPDDGQPLLYCSGGDCSELGGSDTNDFSIEGLISYEPSPGTVFFFGYTRVMEDSSRFRFENIRPVEDGLFAKVSYLFRL